MVSPCKASCSCSFQRNATVPRGSIGKIGCSVIRYSAISSSSLLDPVVNHVENERLLAGNWLLIPSWADYTILATGDQTSRLSLFLRITLRGLAVARCHSLNKVKPANPAITSEGAFAEAKRSPRNAGRDSAFEVGWRVLLFEQLLRDGDDAHHPGPAVHRQPR